MFKRIFALVMCLVIMCGVGITATAQEVSSAEDYAITVSENGESQIQPRYNYTNIISASLLNSNGNALCGANVLGYNGTTTKIVITMTLQKKTLLWWSKVQEWTMTVNSYTATISKTATVDSGKHRVKVNAVVYSGSKSEEITLYSQEYTF